MGYYYPKEMTYDEMETEAAKLIARMIMLEDDEEEAELQKEKENKAASEVASVLNEKQQINPNDGNASEDIQTIQK
jgi:hypothetical protein